MPTRINVQKTYKLYIGGNFPRTESGRCYKLHNKGKHLANICQASRKDLREAVTAARAAQQNWANKTAYNRAQILYRIAEILETRSTQLIHELILQGATPTAAKKELTQSVDRLVYYAGWADKYQQIFSSVNPVSSNHFNFSILEPTGVIFTFPPDTPSLLGLISTIAPALAGGNTLIALASQTMPLTAITLAEIIHTSDVPAGAVNILTGDRQELLEHAALHMDINAIIYCGNDHKQIKQLQLNSAENLKRIILHHLDWTSDKAQTPYHIQETQEVKTTWHPIGI